MSEPRRATDSHKASGRGRKGLAGAGGPRTQRDRNHSTSFSATPPPPLTQGVRAVSWQDADPSVVPPPSWRKQLMLSRWERAGDTALRRRKPPPPRQGLQVRPLGAARFRAGSCPSPVCLSVRPSIPSHFAEHLLALTLASAAEEGMTDPGRGAVSGAGAVTQQHGAATSAPSSSEHQACQSTNPFRPHQSHNGVR